MLSDINTYMSKKNMIKINERISSYFSQFLKVEKIFKNCHFCLISEYFFDVQKTFWKIVYRFSRLVIGLYYCCYLRCSYLKRLGLILNELAWNNTQFSKFKVSRTFQSIPSLLSRIILDGDNSTNLDWFF